MRQPTPTDPNRPQSTKSSKVFMVDAPGWEFPAPDARNGAQNVETLVWINNYTTRVLFGGKQASNNFEWRVVMRASSDGVSYVPEDSWIYGAVDHSLPIPAAGPPDENGIFRLDCSSVFPNNP